MAMFISKKMTIVNILEKLLLAITPPSDFIRYRFYKSLTEKDLRI